MVKKKKKEHEFKLVSFFWSLGVRKEQQHVTSRPYYWERIT